ncbi:MAG: hypothetical protein IJT13_04825 [Bacteroidaceae bacterium]|nr:hypothetical protein [Bacteroidaceae bacterium]
MKKHNFSLLAALLLLPLSLMAQDKKQFTLDNLIPGGATFWDFYPEYTYCAWNDNVLMELDADNAYKVSDNKGKLLKNRETFLTKDDINSQIDQEKYGKVRSMMYCSFDYPGQPVVTVQTDKGKLQYDYKNKQVVWFGARNSGAQAEKF